MRWHAIRALVSKDLRLFFRNRFFAFITVLSLVAFIGVYLALPPTLDDTFSLGVYAPGIGADALLALLEADEAEAEGLALLRLESDAALRQAVQDESVLAGLALPQDLQSALLAGERPTIELYLRADTPTEMRDMMVGLVEGLALALSGVPLPIEVRAETLGPDLAGEPIPHRDRMRPLFAVMILMMEVFGLASLLSEEIVTGTLRALITTPLRVGELFLAKGLTSVLMSLSQAVVLMWAMGALGQQPLIVLTALLLGAILVTGIGFLLAASGRDMLSVVGLATLALLILSIPPMGVLFPGLLTAWVRVIPSHYLAVVVHQAANLGAGWAQVWQPLLILLGFDLAIGWAGVAVLKRRFA
jgi:ABC-2 type transport system permease protein